MSVIKNKPKPSRPPAQLQKSAKGTPWFYGTFLFLFTLLVYIPSYKAGFIWDDDVLAGSPLFNLGWSGLRDLWLTAKYGDYVPITATTFWIEWQIHGGMKEIQHATNVVLQAFNAVLIWRVLVHLKIPGAWVAAAIFAVHPVCVSSVTWLAERKNTLSMFFYLLSLLFFLRSENRDNISRQSRRMDPSPQRMDRNFWFSFAFFLLALLSKSSTVVLPVVMLLCLWWQTGKIGSREIKRVSPFFIFAFLAGIVTLVGHHLYAPKNTTGDDWLIRVLTASRAFWFYLEKDFFPVGLTLHYPRWKISPASPLSYLPALAIIGIFILFWRTRRSWGKACLFGFGYYLIALGPTLGVLNMAFLSMGQVADHFQYLALPGIIALLIGGAFDFFQRLRPELKMLNAGIFSAVLLAPLTFLCWQHQRLMANPEALWRDNIKKNPDSWVAQNNYGGLLAAKGQFESAIPFYREALKKQNELPTVQVNLGRALMGIGQAEEAVVHYAEAIRLEADNLKTQNDLGIALIAVGKTNDAISSFEKAVEGDPNNRTFLSNLVRLHMLAGSNERAAQICRNWLERDPASSRAHQYTGQLLLREGKVDSAVAHFKEAVQLDPHSKEARSALQEILSWQHKNSTNQTSPR